MLVSQARALRQEREKAAKKKESANQQVRLSYDANDKSFVLGGGQDEVQRILADLSKMSQIKTITSPMINHSTYNEQSLASSGGVPQRRSNSPMPSPPPSHLSINMSPHSKKNHDQYGCLHPGQSADELDPDMIATPG